MKRSWIAAAALVAASVTGVAQTPLKVCPDPAAPCKHRQKTFEPYELSFQLPARLGKREYTSAPFYAVVLERVVEPDCDDGETSSAVEAMRKRAQTLFPGRKVFADHQCPNMTAVSYRIDGEPNTGSFIGVYAGASEAEAQAVYKKAKAEFPAASLHRMTVSYDHGLLYQ